MEPIGDLTTASRSALGEQVLARVRDRLASEGIDALIAMAPENFRYCAGTVPPSLRTVRQRLAFAVIPHGGPSEAVVVALEGPLMKAESWIDEVTVYVEFEQHPVDALVEALRRRGLADGRLGIELTFLSALDHARLTEALPGAELVAVDDLLAELRTVKVPAEVELIQQIGVAAERIHYECCADAAPGMTERELGSMITERYGAAGGDELTMLVVGSGPRSAHPNAPPTDRPLEAGDLVRMDIIGTKRGYYSDVARTAVVGTPSDRAAEIYKLLNEVHARALDGIRPGAKTNDVHRIYAEAMERAQLPAYHFLGHGLGLTLHEEPFIDKRSSTSLVEGMVLCIEPLTFVEGEFGIQIEDEVIVTADGCQPITRAPDELIEIGA